MPDTETPTPQAGTQTETPPAGAGSDGGQEPKSFDADYVNKLRSESAGYRTRLKELEAKVKEHENAQLSETERLQQERDEARTRAETALSTANQRLVAAEARVQAAALGIKPERIGAALRLADLSGVAVGDDGEADGTAVKSALEAVLKDLPELKAAGVPAPQVGATNPARAQAGTGGFSRSQLRDPQFYAANKDAIMRAFREGRIADD